MLTVKQCPFTGPYASSATNHPNKGPTVQALKRMLVRLDMMESPAGGMLKLTNFWPADGKFDRAFRTFQLKNYLPANGVYGEQTWKVVRGEKLPNGEHALDQYAQKLIRDEWEEQNVPDEEDFRKRITEFCLAAEANEDNWHYAFVRPLDVSVDPRGAYIRSDCSMFCIQAYHWARTKSGLLAPDPSKFDYSGFGNTDYHMRDHPRVTSGLYKVADIAHYNGVNTNHATICRKAGTATTSVWTSNGEEAGPDPRSLHYRTLWAVVRPPLSE